MLLELAILLVEAVAHLTQAQQHHPEGQGVGVLEQL